ncbi:MAG: hypothetical protein U1U88_000253 [Lawsonella clevelandensis]
MGCPLLLAGIIVLAYITLGGTFAAIYNEVMQFFVVVAGLLTPDPYQYAPCGGWNQDSKKRSSMMVYWANSSSHLRAG